ncbi:DUF2274 domain-containing protein [Inquilinus limosus]|uniref:DUF2274 domain-containing protein n=1 Tax=Inquilinus limosus TaxID=171674 RepID=UPI003F14133E
MAKLKLGAVLDDRPVKLTIELPAAVHRDLLAYAELLGGEIGQAVEPIRLVAPMLARFMATDRGFLKVRRAASTTDETAEDRAPATTGAPNGFDEAGR